MPAGNKIQQRGYTLAVLMIVIASLSIAAGSAAQLTSQIKRRAQEQELIFRGQAYQHAVRSYYLAGGAAPVFPRNLEDLIKDSRFAHKRHIRKLYTDPTSDQDWIIVRAIDGGIAGVSSANHREPLKKANFPAGFDGFIGAVRYSDWLFEFRPVPE